jgi:hypothetical protein
VFGKRDILRRCRSLLIEDVSKYVARFHISTLQPERPCRSGRLGVSMTEFHLPVWSAPTSIHHDTLSQPWRWLNRASLYSGLSNPSRPNSSPTPTPHTIHPPATYCTVPAPSPANRAATSHHVHEPRIRSRHDHVLHSTVQTTPPPPTALRHRQHSTVRALQDP